MMAMEVQRIKLTRFEFSDHGTFGRLCFDSLKCCTIEPPWRNNRPNRSCIPSGRYEVIPHRSPRFGVCLLVTDVPDRSHILFHGGNVAGDVELGFHSHSRGCILPGLKHGRLSIGGRTQTAVLNSRTAMRKLMQWIDGNSFVLEIN